MTARILDAVVVFLAAALLLILAFGGIDARVGPLNIRLHDWVRPFVLLCASLAIRGWVSRRQPARDLATAGFIALLIAVGIAYLQHHDRYAGGLDSYGYVSSAALLASGRLTEPQPIAAILPFEGAAAAAAPLGYVTSPDGHSRSPRFPLGLPLVMAPFLILGPAGPFLAPLVMAFGALAFVYLLAREPGTPVSGLFAVAVVAVDPLMFHYALQPMSDVPATFWLLAALWLRLERPNAAIAAGFCGGMAMLTRPALLPAVLVLAAVTARSSTRRATVVLVATLAGFIGLQMLLNHVLYGGVALSGYGPASQMFELSVTRLTANATNYAKWLTYSHTPLIWLIWPSALIILRDRAWAWQVSAVAAAAAAPYLFYLVFDDWESSRFLLPTIVLVLILFARALSHLPHLPHLPHLLLVTSFLIAFSSHRFLDREGVYQFARVEMKYALVGEWFKTHTSARAVVLAGLHSGSINLYGDRQTVRWDQIPSTQLPATLRNLQAAGYEPYLALDNPSEPQLFEARFGVNASAAAEPVGRVRVVDIYRFLSAR